MANNIYSDATGRYPIKDVTIESVDGAVFDYFDKKLSPHVDKDDGGETVGYKVPVFFATGERWALIRKNNFRDEHGTLILPIISIRRTNIDRTPGFGGMAQEVKSLTVSKVIHPKTSNVQNQVDARKRRGVFFQPKVEPIIEHVTIPFPDFAQVLYEVTIWTQYNTHMNEILEKIFYKYELLDSFVMPLEYDGNHPKGDSYYFVGFRDGGIDKLSNDEDLTNQERIIKYRYGIRVPAYFLLNPDDEATATGRNPDGTKSVYKNQTINKIKVTEKVSTIEEYKKLFG